MKAGRALETRPASLAECCQRFIDAGKSAGDVSLQLVQNGLSILAQQDALLCVDDAQLNIHPLSLGSGVELSGTNTSIQAAMPGSA